MSDERKLTLALDKKLLKVHTGLYIYEYPDTGRSAPKKKPPDRAYFYQGSLYLIEYKMPGEKPKTHQEDQLKQAADQGAFSYVGTFLDSGNVYFENFTTKEGFMLQYEYGQGFIDLDKLFDKLKTGGYGND